MVIKQLLELTGAGPWEQKDGTFYLASLLSMNLCSKEKCWYYETRSATEIIYEDSIITTTFFFLFFFFAHYYSVRLKVCLNLLTEERSLAGLILICKSTVLKEQLSFGVYFSHQPLCKQSNTRTSWIQIAIFRPVWSTCSVCCVKRTTGPYIAK